MRENELREAQRALIKVIDVIKKEVHRQVSNGVTHQIKVEFPNNEEWRDPTTYSSPHRLVVDSFRQWQKDNELEIYVGMGSAGTKMVTVTSTSKLHL